MAYLTQTTLAVDDTAAVVGPCAVASRPLWARLE